MEEINHENDKRQIRENFTVSNKMTAYDIILLCVICLAFVFSCVAVNVAIKVKGILSKLKVVTDPKQRQRLLHYLEKQGEIPKFSKFFGDRKLRQDLGLI